MVIVSLKAIIHAPIVKSILMKRISAATHLWQTGLWLITLPLSQVICNAQNVDITFSSGFQHEQFSWSIAGNINGQNPNIYSELIWKDLRGVSTEAGIDWQAKGKFRVKTCYSRMFILSGAGSDTDYLSDNRSDASFAMAFASNKGWIQDGSAAFGYDLVKTRTLFLVSYFGYGLQNQQLYLLGNGGLHSSYRTRWSGPFGGLQTAVRAGKKIHITSEGIYNQSDYHATADWNLVESFRHPVSFKHRARGFGVSAAAGTRITVTNDLTIGLSARFTYWSTGAGIDELFLNSGDVVKTRLNDVTRTGYAVVLRASRNF